MPEDILYTKHAKEMMELRKISKELVNEALTDPDEVLDQDGKKINHKIIGDKKLRVIHKESGNSYIVITTCLTHKNRYKTGEEK